MVDEIPADAQRSPDGHYWWDTTTNEWQAVPGGAADPATPAGGGATTHDGTVQFEIGHVTEFAYSHDEVVAMLQDAGVQLPAAEGGEAYA